jgi:hypothetical protein
MMAVRGTPRRWPFLDWSLVQPGYQHMPRSPKYGNVPYGIAIRSQPAHRSVPWLRADRPWEEQALGKSQSLIYENGTYRLWYEAAASDYNWRSSDLTDYSHRLCYAESSDGVRWHKPNLGLVEFRGDRNTNIVFDRTRNRGRACLGGTVFVDPVAPSAERYKHIFLGAEPRTWQMQGAVSADGLQWSPIAEPLIDGFMSDTQTTAHYDPVRRRYVGYFRTWMAGGVPGSSFRSRQSRRSISRAETADFRIWPHPETTAYLGVAHHPSHDLYTNAHALYPGRDDLHLFFPARFSREKDTLQVHLATSRDGVRLEYFGDRPVVPIEADGAGDEKRVYAGVGIVPLGTDTVAVPCSRWHHTHNEDTAEGFREEYQGEYFWATWSTDRFAAVEADERGFFATPVFDDPLAGLSVNATTYPSGEIRVQLTDETGVPIEGYTFAQCDPVRGDQIRHPVTWRGRPEIALQPARPLVIQFRMTRAKLYALYTT